MACGHNLMSRTLTIDDGDVVLFSRRCLSMPFVPAFICASAKLTAWTPYDHIGVVTRDPSTGRLQLLEANMGGVTAHALHERLVRSKALAFAVRKLVATGSGGGRDVSTARRDIQACAREIVGRPYNPSFLDMTRALAASVVHHGTAAAAACDHAHRVARDAPSSPTAALAAPVADDSAATSRGYYCSHLVADVLVRAGVLARARRSQVITVLPSYEESGAPLTLLNRRAVCGRTTSRPTSPRPRGCGPCTRCPGTP